MSFPSETHALREQVASLFADRGHRRPLPLPHRERELWAWIEQVAWPDPSPELDGLTEHVELGLTLLRRGRSFVACAALWETYLALEAELGRARRTWKEDGTPLVVPSGTYPHQLDGYAVLRGETAYRSALASSKVASQLAAGEGFKAHGEALISFTDIFARLVEQATDSELASLIAACTQAASDYEQIASMVLRPERPRLVEALSLVEGLRDPKQAWRALVDGGLLPGSWHAETPAVRTVSGAVAFASAFDAVVACEAHGRELVRRLLPWGERPIHDVHWKLLPARKLKQADVRSAAHPSEAFLCAANAAENLGPRESDVWGSEAMRLATRKGQNAPQRVFVRDLLAHAAWTAATKAGAVVRPWPMPRIRDRTLCIPEATHGKSFAELSNPFDSVLAIWGRGCVVDVIADAIVLGMPEDAPIRDGE